MDRVPGFEPGGWRFEPSSVRFFMTMIPLLAHRHSSYVETMTNLLGKGEQHASIFYEEVLRRGNPPSLQHPAFRHAEKLLEQMKAHTDLDMPQLVEDRTDGFTEKILLRTREGLEIESVLIPMQSGNTLCISSQIGCRMGCTFCETGRMGLLRNLKTEEILSQVFIARHVLKFQFNSIVFMGMGEPFDNYDNVLQAARILIDQKGFGFGKRNVTLSTSGKPNEIKRFAKEIDDMPNLAVSINAPVDSIRTRLMPINRKHSMIQLYEAMKEYNLATNRQILVAYVLIRGINNSPEHAVQLADYLQGLDVKINVIPYNPQSRDPFQPPDSTEIDQFVSILRNRGCHTLLRVTKGRQIMAGCGQLGNRQSSRRSLLESSNSGYN